MRIIRRPLKVPPRKKLRAATQRSSAKYTEEDYSAEEPNVKLSRAFVVVLLLHVVAVGGIFAFSALKDHQTGGTTGKPESAGLKIPATPGNAGRPAWWRVPPTTPLARTARQPRPIGVARPMISVTIGRQPHRHVCEYRTGIWRREAVRRSRRA